MGSVCYSPEQAALNQNIDNEKQFIKVSNLEALKEIKFGFSTEKLIHVSGDLLVLFMDHSTNINKNDHFLKLPMQGAKLEEHAKAYFQRRKLKEQPGTTVPHFITFSIIIPTLNFSKVSILFCNIWKKGEHNDSEFKTLLRDYFDSISNQNIKSMVITEFTSELGVNLTQGVKRILREVVRMSKKPQIIEFCCFSDESKSVYMDGVNENREDIEKSFVSKTSGAESNYY